MSVLPTIALIAIMFYFMRQMMGANNRNMQFGKTNAKTNEPRAPRSSLRMSPAWMRRSRSSKRFVTS